MLASLYVMRSLGIIMYLILPVTSFSTIVFASFMGLTSLGTIPLTSGLVAQIFGTPIYGYAIRLCVHEPSSGKFCGNSH